MEVPVSQRLISLPGASSREYQKELPAHPRWKEAISALSFLQFFWQKLLAGKSPGFMALMPWSEGAGVQVLRLWSAQGQLQAGSQKELRAMGKLGIGKGAVNQWGTGTFCSKGKGRAWAGPD